MKIIKEVYVYCLFQKEVISVEKKFKMPKNVKIHDYDSQKKIEITTFPEILDILH